MSSGNSLLTIHKLRILHDIGEITALGSLVNFTSTSSAPVALVLFKDLIIFDSSSGVVGDQKRYLEHFVKFVEI